MLRAFGPVVAFTVATVPLLAQAPPPLDPAVLKQKIDFKRDAGPLPAALKALGKQLNITVVVNKSEFERVGVKDFAALEAKKIDVKAATAGDVFDELLRPVGGTYLVQPYYVEIVPRPAKK